MWKCRYTIPSLMDWWLKYFAREITINCFATGHQHCFGFDWSGEILYLSVISWSIGLHPGTVPRLGSFDHSRNEPSWLLWHWSSRGQLALCNGRVSYTFNWQSENQCQRINAKWILFLSHAKKANKTFRKSAICPRRPPCLLIILVHSLGSVRLDTAWLVRSVTNFDLIGWMGRCSHQFQRAKYKFSWQPKTLVRSRRGIKEFIPDK